MKSILSKTAIAICLLTMAVIQASFSQTTNLGYDRVQKLKKSIVNIYVDGIQAGTGFFISDKARVATCWHVVGTALYQDPAMSKNGFYLKKIEIELNDKTRYEYVIHKYYLNKGNDDAKIFDYCLLEPIKKKPEKEDYSYFLIGSFTEIDEGDVIYSAGYPLNVKQLIITTGILSSKWDEEVTLFSNPNIPIASRLRNVAWLDLNMNKGNSGSPIIKLGSSLDEDKIIGIQSFNLNPLEGIAQELIKKVDSLANQSPILGIDLLLLQQRLGEVMSLTSFGVAGCISIDYFKTTLD